MIRISLVFLIILEGLSALSQSKTQAKIKPKVNQYYDMNYYGHIRIRSYVLEIMDASTFIYRGMEIFVDGKSVYKDSLGNHIALGDPDYHVKKIKTSIFEIYAGENHRPADIRTTYFKISNGTLLAKKTIPEFLNAAADLDDDGKKEYAGVLFDATELPEPYGSIWYWPILCYEETSDGLALDSALTIKENKLVYGNFYGFQNDAKIILPVYDKFAKETDRLRKIQVKK